MPELFNENNAINLMEMAENAVRETEAKVNVTYKGENGDLPDPVHFDSTEADVKSWVTEALRNGDIPGISADPNANLTDFVVDRFNATEARPFNYLMIRPKTPFGNIYTLNV